MLAVERHPRHTAPNASIRSVRDSCDRFPRSSPSGQSNKPSTCWEEIPALKAISSPNVLLPENALASSQVVWSGCWKTYFYLSWIVCCLQMRVPAEVHCFNCNSCLLDLIEKILHAHTHTHTYTLSLTHLHSPMYTVCLQRYCTLA